MSSIGRSCSVHRDQAVASLALVRIVARAVSFVGAVGRDPDVVVDEPGPLAPPGVGRGERERVVAGQELVADRLADVVLARSD